MNNSQKISKFMICENPILNDNRVFILHTREPLIIAEAFHFDENNEKDWLKCKDSFNVGASVDYPNELICLGAVIFESNDVDTLANIMRRMGDWYYNYLKWEDKNL